MKNPKKLTRTQKEKLTRKKLDATKYVVVEEDAYTFTVQEKEKVRTSEGLIILKK
jgi:hypothetical protein